MSDRSALGERMKRYERASQGVLTPRMPAILRVDGKAFHTLTRGMAKPWDPRVLDCMQHVARALCSQAQGARLAYVQSDEVSVLLVDYATLKTQGWFDGEVQKMVSIAASVATLAAQEHLPGAMFDARVFSVPREDVNNYFLWRQRDAERNSIQGLAQAHFSHKQIQGLDTGKLQDKLFTEAGVNWNDCETDLKRGACIVRKTMSADELHAQGVYGIRSAWVTDREPPRFSQDPDYIEKHVYVYNVQEITV